MVMGKYHSKKGYRGMSSIKQCDRDGGMFSTNLKGWGSGTFTIHRKYDDGSTYEEKATFDFCPDCISDMTGSVRVPMPALQGQSLPRQTDMPLITAVATTVAILTALPADRQQPCR